MALTYLGLGVKLVEQTAPFLLVSQVSSFNFIWVVPVVLTYRIYFNPLVAVLTAVFAVVYRLKIVIHLRSKRSRLFLSIVINSDIRNFIASFAVLDLALIGAGNPALT